MYYTEGRVVDVQIIDIQLIDITYARNEYELKAYNLSRCNQTTINKIFKKIGNDRYRIVLKTTDCDGVVLIEVNEHCKKELIKLMRKYSELLLNTISLDGTALIVGSTY